jgi:hypothetical protein
VRIVVVDTYYPAFLSAHYSARPGLEDRPYPEQLQSLLGSALAPRTLTPTIFESLATMLST